MKGPSPVFCEAVYVLVFSSLTVDLIAASSSASSDRFDCPAELPRVLVKSSLADTPAPGHVRLVKESDNLQKDEECKKPSAAIGAGTDCKDIGAGVDAIEKTREGII